MIALSAVYGLRVFVVTRIKLTRHADRRFGKTPTRRSAGGFSSTSVCKDLGSGSLVPINPRTDHFHQDGRPISHLAASSSSWLNEQPALRAADAKGGATCQSI